MGWSYLEINSAITVSLITWALFAPYIGKLLHTHGSRFVMSLGSVIASLGLFLWAIVPYSYWVFLFSWFLIGMSMSMVLYESAFSVITLNFKKSYKRGINLLTIAGGLAGTIFIPIIQISIDRVGWETSIWLLGLLNLSICFPLHYFFVPQTEALTNKKRLDDDRSLINGDLIKHPNFSGLLIWFSAYAILTSGFSFLLIPLLLDLGAEKNNVIFMMALIGIMQVVGRIFFIFVKEEGNTKKIGFLLNCSFIVSTVLLLFSTNYFALIVFAILYGSAKGIMSVIKGTVVVELFSIQFYTRVNGLLSGFAGLLRALSPLLLSIIWTSTQTGSIVLYMLLILPLFGCWGIYKLNTTDQKLTLT